VTADTPDGGTGVDAARVPAPAAVAATPAGPSALPALPAWSEAFHGDRLPQLVRARPAIVGSSAWLDSRGAGVTVAIVDSGVEASHPAVGGRLVRSVRVDMVGDEPIVVDDDGTDVVGHGTACAGIIHALAPEADIVSVRVLGKKNTTKGIAFARGLDWVVEEGIGIANLSLSSRSEDLYAAFHDLVDQAYFGNTVLVCAASNSVGQASYPSLFSSVISVAAHDGPDPMVWYYNPHPPVEFGARGVGVPVAWRGGASIVGTGNSFAAPHITGLVARIRSLDPGLTPFEVKTLLAAAATTPG
jgi:subtilisin family serine protease